MTRTVKRDNSTYAKKVALRRSVLRELPPSPIVCEPYAGKGHLYLACYTGIDQGLAIEKDADLVGIVASQRPTWRVYQGDAPMLLAAGAGADLPVTLLDLDPYGDPWPAAAAFFASARNLQPVMAVVTNDGMRLRSKRGGLWEVASLRDAVEMFGNNPHANYLDLCRWMVDRIIEPAGYRVTKWAGYHCGHAQALTHWAAMLERNA